jgi:hypothetical protein
MVPITFALRCFDHFHATHRDVCETEDVHVSLERCGRQAIRVQLG